MEYENYKIQANIDFRLLCNVAVWYKVSEKPTATILRSYVLLRRAEL